MEITFSEQELQTIDITLRMRLFIIQLELDDSTESDYRTDCLLMEKERILQVLEGHEVFKNFRDSYDNAFNEGKDHV